MQNKVQLIAYADRFSGGDLDDLNNLLLNDLKGVFGGIHILPFYYPIDGSDAGFDPIDHKTVDSRLGTWDDIRAIASRLDLVADLIVNHISEDSYQFQDYLSKGEDSTHRKLFLTKTDVFGSNPSKSVLDKLYRPRPGFPFTNKTFEDGSQKEFWTTFTPQQIDINVQHLQARQYLEDIINTFASAGIKLIRLDAVGYAVKKAGTSCFMIPETYDFIDFLTSLANQKGMNILVEIHSYYKDQIEIAKRVDYVYDFSIPPLILHSIFSQDFTNLYMWLRISPRNCITVLDTHDGIGIIDVGSDSGSTNRKGLISSEQIDYLVEQIHTRSRGDSLKATGKSASNIDLYQVNCTYYNALGNDDNLYLMSRAIQFFCPGIPQVYYIGFLGESNDMEYLLMTNHGRDINRHYFTVDEVKEALNRPITKKIIELIKIRNSHPAFNGEFDMKLQGRTNLELKWRKNKDSIELHCNLQEFNFSIFSVLDSRETTHCL